MLDNVFLKNRKCQVEVRVSGSVTYNHKHRHKQLSGVTSTIQPKTDQCTYHNMSMHVCLSYTINADTSNTILISVPIHNMTYNFDSHEFLSEIELSVVNCSYIILILRGICWEKKGKVFASACHATNQRAKYSSIFTPLLWTDNLSLSIACLWCKKWWDNWLFAIQNYSSSLFFETVTFKRCPHCMLRHKSSRQTWCSLK